MSHTTDMDPDGAQYALFAAYMHAGLTVSKLLARLLILLKPGEEVSRVPTDMLREAIEDAQDGDDLAQAAFQAYQNRMGVEGPEAPPEDAAPAEWEAYEYQRRLERMEWDPAKIYEDRQAAIDRLIRSAGGRPPEDDS